MAMLTANKIIHDMYTSPTQMHDRIFYFAKNVHLENYISDIWRDYQRPYNFK